MSISSHLMTDTYLEFWFVFMREAGRWFVSVTSDIVGVYLRWFHFQFFWIIELGIVAEVSSNTSHFTFAFMLYDSYFHFLSNNYCVYWYSFFIFLFWVKVNIFLYKFCWIFFFLLINKKQMTLSQHTLF